MLGNLSFTWEKQRGTDLIIMEKSELKFYFGEEAPCQIFGYIWLNYPGLKDSKVHNAEELRIKLQKYYLETVINISKIYNAESIPAVHITLAYYALFCKIPSENAMVAWGRQDFFNLMQGIRKLKINLKDDGHNIKYF